ncbi:MAG: SH3 domain-containing protein [Cyanobacteria bacterium J06639_16]
MKRAYRVGLLWVGAMLAGLMLSLGQGAAQVRRPPNPGARDVTPAPLEPPMEQSPQLISPQTGSETDWRAPASQRPIDVVDRVQTDSDFDQFRDRLSQAIRRRDVDFVMSILPSEGVAMGFGGFMPVSSLDLNNPESWFWQTLEKMMLIESCELDSYPGSIPDAAVWVCPNVANTFYRQYPSPEQLEETDYGLQQVVVMGRGVNVRSQPNTQTSIIGVLSNEVVTFDRFTWDMLNHSDQQTMADPLNGWTPVILPDQTRGFVYNRYVYQPLDPRGLFEHNNGRWQLFRILAGS